MGNLSPWLLNVVINCSELLSGDTPALFDLNTLMSEEDVPKVICAHYQTSFENVSIRLLNSHTPGDGLKANGVKLGRLSISKLRAGRSKISWYSKSEEYIFWIKVSGSINQWVFKKKLNSEDTIRKKDIVLAPVDVSKIADISLLPKLSPIGKAVNRSVRVDQLVTNKLLSDPPLVKRNDRVIIKLYSGGIKLTLNGKALKTGWNVDDNVSVELESKERLNAKVMGIKEVYVEM